MIRNNILLTLVVGIALADLIRQVRPAVWTTMSSVGLCLVILGFVFWTIAHFQLGRAFSVAAQARQLVTSGLYSKIRNPIYVFGSCMIMGVILVSGRLVWLLIFVVLVPLQVWRSRKESAVLEGAFGDEYRKYRASTWF